jgi:imidazolonepropionase
MPVLSNIRLLSTPLAASPGRIHSIDHAALVWRDGKILWTGSEKELPEQYRTEERWDAGGKLVIPGLIDCHTHLGFGGWRTEEFVRKIGGATYEEIARAGGGIASTVAETAKLSLEELEHRALGFLREMSSLGVTTAECKSGYGLSVEGEIRLLELYRRLSERQPMTIVPTFLGAHAIPASADRKSYVASIIDQMIPEIASRGLARFCDVFVEPIAFSVEESRAIFRAGAAAGLRPKLHADQLSDGGGASLAAEVGAISADHLEAVSDAGLERMAEAGVIAVLLPIASLYLRKPWLAAARLRKCGVRFAVATDFNPGSAPSCHLPFALTLSVAGNRLHPEEALSAATIAAAAAIAEGDRRGSLEPGKAADFAVIDAESVAHWLYHFRPNACVMTVKDGKKIYEARN